MCSVVQEWFRALWNYCLCLVLPLSVYCSSKWHTSRNRQVFAIPLKYISLTRHHHFSQVLDLLPDSLVHFSRQSLLPKTYSAFSSSSHYILQCGSVDNVILQSFKKTPCTILVTIQGRSFFFVQSEYLCVQIVFVTQNHCQNNDRL